MFDFNRAYIYVFISGILVSLAANLFTTVFLTNEVPVSRDKVYEAALSLFISSIGAFGVSALLETAKSEWQSAGSPRDAVMIREDYIERGKRKKRLWFHFAIIFFGPIVSIFLFFCD